MNKIDIESAVEKFLNYCAIQRNYSEKTIVTYSIALNQFIDFLNKEFDSAPQLSELDYKAIRPFIPFLYQQKKTKKTLQLKIWRA